MPKSSAVFDMIFARFYCAAENAEAKNRILNKYSIKGSFFGFYAKKY